MLPFPASWVNMTAQDFAALMALTRAYYAKRDPRDWAVVAALLEQPMTPSQHREWAELMAAQTTRSPQ